MKIRYIFCFFYFMKEIIWDFCYNSLYKEKIIKITKNSLYEGNNMQLNLINRPQYLNQLLQFQNTEFIKVLTGVRRSGKSYILMLYREYLLKHNINEHQIIYVVFE